MRQADIQGGFIRVSFPYDHRLVKVLQRIKGSRWNSATKTWVMPASMYAIGILKAFMFSFSESLKKYSDDHGEETWKPDIDLSPIPLPKLPNLPIIEKLLPFQKEGVRFIQSRKGRVLLADDMGLGKTLQALAWLVWNYKTALPAIVVCPNTIKLNWEAEMKLWTDFTGFVWNGRYKKEQKHIMSLLHIINYDILGYNDEIRPDLLKIKANTLIIDEAHLASHHTAQRTKCLLKLAKQTKYVIALTGTPITNRPIDIYYAIRMVRPDMFPSRVKFAERYCGRIHNGYSFVDKGATNTEELHEILTKTMTLRRLKKDVLKDLPPKRRIIVPLEIDNKKEYRLALNNFKSWLKNKGKEESAATPMQKIETLKQLIIAGKMKALIDWIETYLSNDLKLVVFCTHRRTVRDLVQHFDKRAVHVDGSIINKARQEAVNKFQGDDKIKLFVGNIDAAGIGLTLTAAQATATVELGWKPSVHSQAEDRVHRIGQKAQSVEAYYLIAVGTIEEQLMSLLGEKQRMIDAVMEGKNIEDASMFDELLKEIGG